MVVRGRRRQGVAVLAAVVGLAAPLGLALPEAHAAEAGCSPGYQSDFNGDGYVDAVVGDPYAVVAGWAQAGQVVVM
jgi:hypothetical protein